MPFAFFAFSAVNSAVLGVLRVLRGSLSFCRARISATG